MEPSEIRQHLLIENRALRARLDAIEDLAQQISSGESDLTDALRARLLTLLEDVQQHADLEDAILAPALRELDAWGPVRERRMDEHHAQQLSSVESVRDQLEAANTPRATAELGLMVASKLRAQVLREEKELLRDDLLRDDSIEGDVETG